MPSLRDIKRRIRTVNSTQQITKAMEMVAAAKLRKAQQRAERARPYARKLELILTNLARATQGGATPHPYFDVRPVRKTTIVLVTADRGLCGSFNANLIRRTWQLLGEYDTQSAELVLIGKRGHTWFRKRGFPIVAAHLDFGGNLDFARVRRISSELTQRFTGGQTDAIHLVYARFLSIARSEVTVARFLPIATSEAQVGAAADYIFEPDPASIYNDLMPRYATTVIQTALAESFAAEHAARMLAMGAATKSAGEMIDALTLQYNKARQSAITKELLDIVGGANAVQ
ncbi:MAG: ATP synthase F1 subunit gamma [Candidatus Zixiibacteriota bacterium]